MLEVLVALVTLTALEIVLGIDNIIFIAILAGRLPADQQPRARQIGLGAALMTRLLLLASLSFILSLKEPIFVLPRMPFFDTRESQDISVRDLILIVGGLFLVYKSTVEIHDKIDSGTEGDDRTARPAQSFAGVIVTIAIMDIIFSLDSVITAVGTVDKGMEVGGVTIGPIWIMSTAVVLSVAVMLFFAGPISDFVSRHPTLKILALSFLILIGVLLVADGLGQHLNKGYIYFAMAFAVVVEMMNLRVRPHVPREDQVRQEAK